MDISSYFDREVIKRRLRKTRLKGKAECILFMFVAAVNLFAAAKMGYPIITDEYVTMAEGIFLSGKADWGDVFKTLPSTGYYGFGYAILYGWLYRLIGDMHTLFVLVLACNSLLIGLVAVIAYRIASRFIGIRDKESVCLSLCVGFYPAYFIYGKYALNETMLVFLLWSVLYLLLLLQRGREGTRGRVLSLLIGFLSMYAYVVHGRGIAILSIAALSVLLMNLWGSQGRNWGNLWFFTAGTAMVYLGNQYGKSCLARDFFGLQASSMGNTLEYILSPSFFRQFISQGAAQVAIGFIGQAYYIFCATFGFVLVMSAGWLLWIKKKRDDQAMTLLGFYSVGVAALTIMISTAFFSNLYITEGMLRGEYWIYGRYNEMFGGLAIFVSLALIMKADIWNRTFCIGIGALDFLILAVGAGMVGSKIEGMENSSLSYTMVPSIVPFTSEGIYQSPSQTDFIRLSVVIAIIIVILYLLLAARHYQSAMRLMLLYFIYSTVFTMMVFVYPVSSEKEWEIQELAEMGSRLSQSMEKVTEVYVLDAKVPKPRIAFALPKNPVVYLDLERHGYRDLEQVGEDSLIVSVKDERLDEKLRQTYKIKTEGPIHIWAYGEGIKDLLEKDGYQLERRLTEDGKVPMDQAGNLIYRSRRYKVSDPYSSFKYNWSYNSNCILSGEHVRLSRGGRLDLLNFYLDSGVSQIEIGGEGIEKAKIEVFGKGLILMDYVASKDQVALKVWSPSYQEGVMVKVENLGEHPISFRNLTIELDTPVALDKSRSHIYNGWTKADWPV